MNEKEEPNVKKPDGVKRKGFYAALYSCVGVMLVLAAFIGYGNFSRTKGTVPEPGPGPAIGVNILGEGNNEELPEGLQVSQSDVEPVIVEEQKNEEQANEDDPLFTAPDPLQQGDETGNAAGDNEFGQETNQEPGTEIVIDIEAEARNQQDPPTEIVQEQPVQEVFRSFDENGDVMSWPVLGEVVMDFSVDHLVYDKTLEQYRTNSNICIAASEGTAVISAAEGIVKEVYVTRESGRTVVVDHGNGWTTTYSQLQDNILVKVGDVVALGQQIGSVGQPSLFSALLGNHLAFTVYKDGVAVDPNEVLFARQ